MEKIYYSYEEFKKDIKELVKKLDKDYECLVGITRGGLLPLLALSHSLNKKDIKTIKSDFYDFEEKKENIHIEFEADLSKYKNILLVDDIADSGKTLKDVVEFLKQRFKNLHIDTATIFYKKSSIFKPTYFVKEADKEWIDFFWEIDFRIED